MESITRRGSQPLHMARPPGDGPLDATGRRQYTRFEFPPVDKLAADGATKRFFSGHFDAYCPWQMDDPALASDAFAPDMGYTRIHYIMKEGDDSGRRLLHHGSGGSSSPTYLSPISSARSLTRPDTPLSPLMAESSHMLSPIRQYPFMPSTPLSKSMVPSAASIQNHPSFQKYESKRIVTDPVNLEELADYVMKMKPRCVHDLKPMCYLLQSLLGHLLARELEFFSQEIRDLKNAFLRLTAAQTEADAKERASKGLDIINRFKFAAKSARSQSGLEDHAAYLLKLSDQQQLDLEALRRALAAALAELEAANAGLKSCQEGSAALQKQLKEANKARDKALADQEAARKKAESEMKSLKNLLSQKDKKLTNMQKKYDALSGSSDLATQNNALMAELEELKRQKAEGAGAPVEDGNYAEFAQNLLSDPDMEASDRAAKLRELSPPEAARALQALGDWAQAGGILRENDIDFISNCLTCGVLDQSEVGLALQHLGAIGGTVLFAMMRKTSTANITAALQSVPPMISGNLIAAAASQANKRLSALGDFAGHEYTVTLLGTLGDQDDAMLLNTQSPKHIAAVMTKMYNDGQLDEAVDVLLSITRNSRTDALECMAEDVRQVFLNAMNPDVAGAGKCAKCGHCAGDETVEEEEEEDTTGNTSVAFDNTEAGQKYQPSVTDEEITTESRSMEHMKLPDSWLSYMGSNDSSKLLKRWSKDGSSVIAPIKIRSMVTGIYKSKISADLASVRQGKHRMPLGEYVVQWFDNQYGLGVSAQKKMVVFVFSLQTMYQLGTDIRICQFVRLAGLYHKLPSVACDMLMESVEIVSGLMSGSGEMFKTTTEFWSTWLSGKMIPLDKTRQLNILSAIFGPFDKGSVLLARLTEELIASPEVAPSHVELPPGGFVGLSRFTMFVLKVVMEKNTAEREETVKMFRDKAGADKVLSYDEFKLACEVNTPISTPPEGSYAFMYWRAVKMNEVTTAKDVIGAVMKWQDSLKTIGGKKATASVDDAVESFLWHCGKFNECGKMKDGDSVLERVRKGEHGKLLMLPSK